MNSNFLKRYSEKTKKKVPRAAPFLQVTENPYSVAY